MLTNLELEIRFFEFSGQLCVVLSFLIDFLANMVSDTFKELHGMVDVSMFTSLQLFCTKM